MIFPKRQDRAAYQGDGYRPLLDSCRSKHREARTEVRRRQRDLPVPRFQREAEPYVPRGPDGLKALTALPNAAAARAPLYLPVTAAAERPR
jgi:hypothetical protein